MMWGDWRFLFASGSFRKPPKNCKVFSRGVGLNQVGYKRGLLDSMQVRS